MSSLLENPEVRRILKSLLVTPGDGPDRSVVLVGAAHIDNSLRALFEALLPDNMSKRERDDLFGNRGPLGSFGAKVSAAYVVRLIPRDVYDALTALRKLRNDVAHDPDTFQLLGNEERYSAIYALGPGVRNGIRQLAFEMMFRERSELVIEMARAEAAERGESPTRLRTTEEVFAWAHAQPEIVDALRGQLPYWELALGISSLAGVIASHRDAAVRTLGTSETFGALSRMKPAEHPSEGD
jgi:hypothetical protein